MAAPRSAGRESTTRSSPWPHQGHRITPTTISGGSADARLHMWPLGVPDESRSPGSAGCGDKQDLPGHQGARVRPVRRLDGVHQGSGVAVLDPAGDRPQRVAGTHDVPVRRDVSRSCGRPPGGNHPRQADGQQEQHDGQWSSPNVRSTHGDHPTERLFDVKRGSPNICLNPMSSRASLRSVRGGSDMAETDDLTPRQRRILEFIADTVLDRGYPPTVREIGEAVGLTSSSSVHSQLANLERKGLLRKDATKPRAMSLMPALGGEVTATPDPGVQVPLLGRIAAGAPVLAAENVEEYLAVPSGFTGPGEHFALRVTGDSMVGAGILD